MTEDRKAQVNRLAQMGKIIETLTALLEPSQSDRANVHLKTVAQLRESSDEWGKYLQEHGKWSETLRTKIRGTKHDGIDQFVAGFGFQLANDDELQERSSASGMRAVTKKR